ncbi:TolC family protein [Aquimarina sp. D1M17]|uniref:TolC family protein n=1 Tax=Aquimarina acroporae TaxID=2937283 RepID=UPI0020BEC544|nr:TolC family protein [Aquimarina acroporae]MCK8524329.1 TolC family protein [Aquimarina acroporae]
MSQTIISQKTWTLDDCIAYALEHNLQLNDFEFNTESSYETYKQSKRSLLPSIVFKSDYGIRFGRSVDPNDNSISNTEFFANTYSIEGSIDLFQSFQKLNAIKASRFIHNATQEETLQQKYLLAFRVMQAFYDIQFFKGALKIANEQEGISQSNYKLIKKQVELGLMAGADLYEAESILLSDKLGVTQANNQLVAAKIALMQEMNIKGLNDILLQDEIINVTQTSETSKIQSDSVYVEAKKFIPIIKAGELRVKGAQKQLAIERGKLYPSLSLFGQYGTGYFETIVDNAGEVVSFKDQFSDNAFQVVGLSLNIPITDGWSGRSRLKQQKIAVLRAKNDLATQEQQLYQTIQDLVQEYYALHAEYKQTSKNIEVQNLAFDIAQKRYEKGIINAIELFTAKSLLATAQNQNLQVKLKIDVNQSTLDFYRGLPVFDIEN